MESLQVLVATMNQTDFSLAEKMNLQCDTIFANQAAVFDYQTRKMSYGTLQMITTATKGVGLNRNVGLFASDADLLLFADDDVVYYNGLPEAVKRAFEDNSKADVIVFGIDILKGGKLIEKRHLQRRRLYCWNAMRFGAYVIAVRRESVLCHNITFYRQFGGGCIYGSGEDSLFLMDCFRKGLRVYSHDYVLGTCCKDCSSWFTGYHEKYFYDKGALMRYLFPRVCYLMAVYFAVHFKKETKVPCIKRICLMFAGVWGGRKLLPYVSEKALESN